jgi:hypothetical protein
LGNRPVGKAHKNDGDPIDGARTPLRPANGEQDACFDIRKEEGELSAAELEALAAIIRSRVVRARRIGEERF